MVLSNAERQRRHRQRLKAAARGEDLPERARVAIVAATDVVWAIVQRIDMGGFEDWPDAEAMRREIATAKFQKHNGSTSDWLRRMFSDFLQDAEGEEVAVLRKAIALVDAVTLREQG